MRLDIASPDLSETRSRLADWIELMTLASAHGRLNVVSALSSLIDLLDDPAADDPEDIDESGGMPRPPLDRSIHEAKRESLASAVGDEIAHRESCLSETNAYPFRLERGTLVRRAQRGRRIGPCGEDVYLFCLFASAVRDARIQGSRDASWQRKVAGLFQACACVAAGGYVGEGKARWFDFPRPSGAGFLDVLRSVYEEFGVSVRDGASIQRMEGALPNSPKDDGIDVIAWRDTPDGMPSTLYLLGQSASGRNWPSKSAKNAVDSFHARWFDRPPAKFCLPAIFIPFPLHHDLQEPKTLDFRETMYNRFRDKEIEFGLIFDRIRMTHFTDGCLRVQSGGQGRVDGIDRMGDVAAWVNSGVGALRKRGRVR